MSTSSNSNKKVTLKSCDGETFDVDELVASESLTLKHMIEDVDDDVIPLPNLTGKILSKVIEYCKKHFETPAKFAASTSTSADNDELKAFDTEFVKVDQTTLFDLLLAANYLNIKGLLDLTCQTIADLIKDMSVEEVRKIFNIENDFTPDEETALRNECAWAFE